MKNPIILAALLIAAALGGSAVLISSAAANAEADRLNAFFAFLERASQEKSPSGETRLQNLASGVAQSLSKGFQAGFENPRMATRPRWRNTSAPSPPCPCRMCSSSRTTSPPRSASAS